MLENLNLEYNRKQLHGADSSLFLLKENETQFDALIELLSDFAISRQRDIATGGMVDKLCARLTTTEQKTNFAKCDAILLRVGSTRMKYAVENKDPVPTQTGIVAYADVRALFNDTTTVASIEEPEP